eukprot:134937-Chlamydomonas_euryale.AAC.1
MEWGLAAEDGVGFGGRRCESDCVQKGQCNSDSKRNSVTGGESVRTGVLDYEICVQHRVGCGWMQAFRGQAVHTRREECTCGGRNAHAAGGMRTQQEGRARRGK